MVGVAAPKDFLSIGSTASIFVEAYSVENPDTVFSNTIILTTLGVHTTGGPTYNFIIILISLLVFILIILFLIRKRRERILKIPNKPWKIPVEKKYLDKLKEKDEKKYNDTLSMMKDEYKSTMLWYKYYCDSLLRNQKIPKGKIKLSNSLKKHFFTLGKEIKKRNKVRKEKSKVKKEKIRTEVKKLKAEEEKLRVEREKLRLEKQKLEEKKPVEEPEKVEEIRPIEVKEKEVIVDKKAELERLKRERVLSKIKRAQDKQLRKIKLS